MNITLPPTNIEAEESILGGILLDPNAMERVVSILVKDAFFAPSHQEIYQAALTLHLQGLPTDLMSVTTWLSDHFLLDRIGGTVKLAQLLNRTVSAVNIDRFAILVMEKYARRQLITASQEIVNLSYDTAIEISEVLDRSEQKIFNLSNSRQMSDTEHNSEIAAAAFDDLERNAPIYPTGFYDLDELMVGLEPNTLTILAGRPSMGKSFIALNLALSMLQQDLPVLFFSLEMTKKQLEYRLWSLMSVLDCYRNLDIVPIEGDRIRRYRTGVPLSQKEISTIVALVGIASEMPLYINENRGIKVTEIASIARQVKAKEGKLGLVIVDYLQMMASDTKEGNRSYELGDVARGLYKMAGDLEVPILALSQISRGVESRQNKRPMMSDLSQSGILEMVADNVLLAYRDEYYDPSTPDRDILELILAKARHGSTGAVKLLFDKSHGLLKNLV
jgi:replicative DNA helicase